MQKSNTEADILFRRLDSQLEESVDPQYFNEPKEFRSLIEVLGVLGEKADQIITNRNDYDDLLSFLKDRNKAYSKLLHQRKMVMSVIEDVVQFQHGGLNNSVDTMSEVVKEYNKGREDIRVLKKSLAETRAVLTAKKSGQIPLRDLWLRKMELEQTLRMVKEIESLKTTPQRVQRLMQQKKYLSAVLNLNKAIDNMFSEDLVAVGGLSDIREQLMDLKETLLETCVVELREVIIGTVADLNLREDLSGSDSDDGNLSDNRSESARSYLKSQPDDRSIMSFNSTIVGNNNNSNSNSNGDHSPQFQVTSTGQTDAWSLDMRDLDEGVENSLVDPSTCGSLYIRLLVRTVGVLNCEEDVERMLLETVAKSFRSVTLNRLKDFAKNNLERHKFDEDDENHVNYYHSKLFTEYVGSLFDASTLTLNRLLYILKLLSVSKSQKKSSDNSNNNPAEDFERKLKDNNLKLLLSLWSTIESILIQEIEVHLEDPDVSSITDHRKTANRRNSLSSPSDGFELEKSMLIFKPSSRYAAPVYKRALLYSSVVEKIMKENGLDEISIMKNTSSNKALLNKVAQNSKHSLTVMESVALAALQSQTSSVNKVLEMVQLFLEEELIPVIQSTVNNVMRDIQLNTHYFSIESNKLHDKAGPPICYATELCLMACKPLFEYWIQLNQHRGMVSTVLERAIRGYGAAAREELETVSYNMMSASESRFKKSLMNAIKNDPMFMAYRLKIYGGKYTPEDLIIVTDAYRRSISSSRNNSIAQSRNNSVIVNNNSEVVTTNLNCLEINSWTTLWDITNPNYPVTTVYFEKVLNDMNAFKLFASISHGCDILVHRLSGLCNMTAKKSGSSSSSATSKINSILKSNRQELSDAKAGTKDLSKISEEAIAIMRGEMEVSCFYYIHKIAHIKFVETPVGSKGTDKSSISNNIKNNNVDSTQNSQNTEDMIPEEELVLGAFNQYLNTLQESIGSAVFPHVLAILYSPLCTLVPRILQKVICHIFNIYSSVSLTSSTSSAIESQLLKTRVLRIVVSIQQSLSILFQSSHIDTESKRKLIDMLTDDFEKLRRFVTLFNMPVAELELYLKNNSNDYSKDEIKLLWSKASNRVTESILSNNAFEDIWKDLESRKL